MPTFMCQWSYKPESLAGVAKTKDNRQEADVVAAELGGKVISYYYSFGDYDGMAVVEVPDSQTALTFVMIVVSPGRVQRVKTTQLFTMEEVQAAKDAANALPIQLP